MSRFDPTVHVLYLFFLYLLACSVAWLNPDPRTRLVRTLVAWVDRSVAWARRRSVFLSRKSPVWSEIALLLGILFLRAVLFVLWSAGARVWGGVPGTG